MNYERRLRLQTVVFLCGGLATAWGAADDAIPSGESAAGLSVLAQDASEEIPSEWRDQAFDRFFDVSLLRQGLAGQNPSALCDAALQLGEGERVLFRKHKSLTADQALALALRLAVDKRDTTTLERIGRAAKASSNRELAAAVESMTKTAQTPRAAANLSIPLDKSTAEKAQLFQAFADTIGLARSLADRPGLNEIKTDIEGSSDLGNTQKSTLVKAVTEALESLPEKPDPAAEALSKLMDGARDDNISDVRASVASGWRGVSWGKHIDHLEEAKLLAKIAYTVSTGDPSSFAVYLDSIKELLKVAGPALVAQACRGNTVRAGGREWSVGVATYNHWKYVKIGGYKKKLSEPNTCQPYLRWR